MIEIKNIIKSYGTLRVLRGIDLVIPDREVVAVTGASGAGKSTLLHILGTLDTPDSGEILYDGENIARYPAGKLSAFLLELLGLEERASHKPSELSGGEQQRVSVARALINSPRAVLADEPSGNLDSQTRNELHRLFFRLRDELHQTFVIVTHDAELAAMSDRKITLSDGRIA